MGVDHSMDSMSAIVREQADRLYQQHATKDALTAADRGEWAAPLWLALEEAGLPLALVPEDAGGVGLGAADAAHLIRRAAYYAAPLPLAETMLANRLWSDAGGGVSEGPITLAPTNARDALTLEHSGGAATLGGVAHAVPWGTQARLLVLVRTGQGEARLGLLPAGLIQPNRSRRNIAYEPRDDLRFDAVAVDADALRPAPDYLQGNGLMAFGAAIRTQQMIGGMERCLDYALGYANERVQFGRPLAKFQAIQHMLAVAAGHFAAASAAADALLDSERLGDDEFSVAIAKARVGEAAGHVAAICHQVHGAMGFTQEHPLHFSTRRLWAWRDEWGAETYWQEQIGRIVCAQGGEGFWPLLADRPTPAAAS